MAQKILIVEDDPDIRGLLALLARDCAADVRTEPSGSRGLLVAQQGIWDLVVLDWILPDIDGITVCRRLRERHYHYPIMILTARTCESDHVAGLDAGADDYVDKPFGVLELKARIRAQLRRATLLRDGPSDFDKRALVVRGALTLDPASHEARLSEQPLELTAREFDLLLQFMRHPGQVFSRGELLDKVWGSGFEGYDHTVNSHINRLRAKIECNPAEPRWIETVRGVGYRFNSHTTI